MRVKRYGNVFVGTAAALLVWGMPLSADETIERTFEVGHGGKLVLDTERGSVEVQTWDKAVVEVAVENPRALAIAFKQRGDDVHIKADDERSGWKLIDWPKKQAVFHIKLPRDYHVQIKTDGGHIWVEALDGTIVSRTGGGHLKFGQIAGAIDARTGGGHITLVECAGPVQATTSGGHMYLSKIDGNVEAKTAGGHINLEHINGEVQARTSGGMVRALFKRHPLQACRLETSGGHVEVTLPEDSPVHLDARTGGGRVSTELPVMRSDKLSTRLKADVNGGGPELFLRTDGGHIKLYKL